MEIVKRVNRYAQGVDDDVIATVVTVGELQRLIDMAGESFGPAVAYATPPVDDNSVRLGEAQERQNVLRWLRGLDGQQLLGRRTVSVATISEVLERLAEAITCGEHR
jgi:hypothetical protein